MPLAKRRKVGAAQQRAEAFASIALRQQGLVGGELFVRFESRVRARSGGVKPDVLDAAMIANAVVVSENLLPKRERLRKPCEPHEAGKLLLGVVAKVGEFGHERRIDRGEQSGVVAARLV